MVKLLHNRHFYIGIAALVIVFVLLMIHGVSSRNNTPLVTAIVETGPVRELISVSGIAKAEQTAELAFPTTGIIQTVHVKIGDKVEAGDRLITLDSRALYADKQDALAALTRAVADRDELLKGPTLSERDVTSETLASKEEALETTILTETQKVDNAYRNLLSTDLTAESTDPEDDAVQPTISGTYNCGKEGSYLVEMYSSSAGSGYSYNLSGLETGTYSAYTSQPSEFGTCGLRIQFYEDSSYSRSIWRIDIPNTKSSQYVTNRNAHAFAVTQAESAVSLAEQALLLAKADSTNKNAPARSESVSRADAAVIQAQARLSRIDSTISDRSLTAPFAGVITEIDVLPGETVTTAPVVTLLASDKFEVTARIPEIDIGKLLIGQKVEMFFDARSDEILTGRISFISLKSTEIDGVSYYEAIIQLDEIPAWIRSGLNADIEIIVREEATGLRVPKRFVTKTDSGYSVIVQSKNNIATSTIEVLLEGNDGFMSITGLSEGDILVAP
ncbi:efflux RND transporter periplasmic adaptor subunit [Candidatus Nomurabacteria bacterium]|nr:efflux RND transporter periplasmic adaptor subunit [Candidatus Nomurabacteria bacterium]